MSGCGSVFATLPRVPLAHWLPAQPSVPLKKKGTYIPVAPTGVDDSAIAIAPAGSGQHTYCRDNVVTKYLGDTACCVLKTWTL